MSDTEQRSGCFVYRLVENNTGLPSPGTRSFGENCDGTLERFPRRGGMGFGPTAHSPAYEWKWVKDCDHE